MVTWTVSGRRLSLTLLPRGIPNHTRTLSRILEIKHYHWRVTWTVSRRQWKAYFTFPGIRHHTRTLSRRGRTSLTPNTQKRLQAGSSRSHLDGLEQFHHLGRDLVLGHRDLLPGVPSRHHRLLALDVAGPHLQPNGHPLLLPVVVPTCRCNREVGSRSPVWRTPS